MPSSMAAQARAALQDLDREGLVLRRAVGRSSTGFVNVIVVKGKFQARLQVPGDGRGGVKKRKQVPLPGLFDKAEDRRTIPGIIHKGLPRAGPVGRRSCGDADSSRQEAQAEDASPASSSRAATATACYNHSGNAVADADAMPAFRGRIACPDAASGLLPATLLICSYYAIAESRYHMWSYVFQYV